MLFLTKKKPNKQMSTSLFPPFFKEIIPFNSHIKCWSFTYKLFDEVKNGDEIAEMTCQSLICSRQACKDLKISHLKCMSCVHQLFDDIF